MNVKEKKTKKGISYKITYFVNGKAHYTTLYDKKSVKYFEAELEKNKLNNSGFQPYSTEKLEKYYKKWIESKGINNEVNTVESYNHSFKKLLPHLGHICINCITSEQIKFALDKIMIQVKKESKGKFDGKSTAQHCYVALNACLNEALIQRKIPFNPCSGVKKPKTNNKKEPLKKDEIFKAIEYTNNHKTYRFMALPIALAGLGGLRRGEVCGLKWKNIDEDFSLITIDIAVVKTQTKGNLMKNVKNDSSKRHVPISNSVKALLKQQKEHIEFLSKTFENFVPSEFICTNAMGIPIKPDYITKTSKKIFVSLGFSDKVSFHSARHGFATILANDNNTNLTTIQSLMGHADIKTTANTYITVENQSRKSAISQIDSSYKKNP